MKHIPILFSTEMVRAILDGRKKMTRRTKGIPKFNPDDYHCLDAAPGWYFFERYKYSFSRFTVEAPYSIDDILWVRESFYKPHQKVMFGDYWYKADLTPQGWDFKWKPSIHMPKDACRIFLRVTDVRCERLQDISEQDAVDEGIKMDDEPTVCYKNYMSDKWWYSNPIDSFRSLWISINGQKSWGDNPFVWVVSFERCERPADFLNH